MIKICISVTSHALDPFPPSQTVTPCRTPSPWSVTYFMDGPQHSFYLGLHYTHFLSIQVLPGASIMGKLGSRLPDFGQGVVKYYYILSCKLTGNMFESGDF